MGKSSLLRDLCGSAVKNGLLELAEKHKGHAGMNSRALCSVFE